MNPFLFTKNFFYVALGALPILAMLLLGWTILSTMVYFLEFVNRLDQTYFSTLYFSAITALTVGYGDISPQTPVGRVLAILLALLGIVLTGIVVAAVLKAIESTAEGIDLWMSKSSER